jgi:histidyl-tRNA synthetase
MADALVKVPKGTRDLSGEEVAAFVELESVARRVFTRFSFSEVRTPIFEHVELFSRAMGETSDVVEKEMFSFSDRGERDFALRPEGTAGVVRHFIENSLWVQSGQQRLFYTGPMFRAERPQAGRYRQFWQIGSEHFGSADASADADTVVIGWRIFAEFGLTGLSVHVNSLGCGECRPKHRAALLTYLRGREKDLTEESRKRMEKNPLRVLDSKVDGPKLTDAPAMKDFLCDACRAHHDLFRRMIADAGVSYEQNDRLVRGLDYYTRTVFEFVSPDLGAQSAVAAGGRYDDLVKMLGGPATPAVGFALGMDRAVSIRLKKGPALARAGGARAHVVAMDDASAELAFRIADQLRQAGFAVPPITAGRKFNKQMSAAVDDGARWAVLVGENEVKANTATVKNLETREQKEVPAADVARHLA